MSANQVRNSGDIGTEKSNTIVTAKDLDNTEGNIQGSALQVTADRINNTQGTLQAGDSLIINAKEQINNTEGRITSAGQLSIRDDSSLAANAARTLAIQNQNGTISAGKRLALEGASLTYNGTVLSKGDFTSRLEGDYTHRDGQEFYSAKGAVSLFFTGTITNESLWHAEGGLNLSATTILNTENGIFSSFGQTRLETRTGDLTNLGQIKGDAVVLVSKGDLQNRNGSITGKTLDALVGGNVDNSFGTINTTGRATVQAVGDFSNEQGQVDTGSLQLVLGGGLQSSSGAQQASITTRTGNLEILAEKNIDLQDTQLASAGSLLVMSTQGNLTLSGVDAKAKDSLALAAVEGTLNINAQQQTQTRRVGKNGVRTDTTVQVSQLTAGSDLLLQSGGEMNLYAPQLNAERGNLNILAGGDLNLFAVAGTTHANENARKGVTLLRTPFTLQNTLSWQGVELTAGNNVFIQSGGNLLVERGNAKAGGDITLLAAGNATFTAPSDLAQSTTRGVGMGYNLNRTSVGTQTQSSAAAQGFTANAGGNLTVASQKNLDMQAVNLNAGKDLTLYAKEDLTIKPGFQLNEQVNKDNPKTLAAAVAEYLGINNPDLEPGQRRQTTTRTVVPNQLNAGGDLSLIADGKLALIGVQGTAQDILLQSKGTLTIIGAQNESLQNNRWANPTSGTHSKTRYQDSERSSETYVGSQLNGRNLTLISGGDVLMEGSQINLSGSAAIIGNGKFTIMAAEQKQQDALILSPLERLLNLTTLQQGAQPNPQQSTTLAPSQIKAEGPVVVRVVDDLHLAGGNITSTDVLDIKAKNINLFSQPDSVISKPSHGRLGNRPVGIADLLLQNTVVPAELKGGKGLYLDAEDNIITQGARLQSGTDLSLNAGKEIQLYALTVVDQQDRDNSAATQAVTDINAQGKITLKSGGDMSTLGSQIKSQTSDVTLDASGILSLAAVLDQTQTNQKKKSGGLFSKTRITTTVDELVKGTTIETGEGGKLTLKSGGDMKFESVDLKPGTGGLDLESGGQLILSMANDSHYKDKQTSINWVVLQKNKLKGQSELAGVENQIQSNGPIQIKVANGLSIEYAQRRGESAEAAFERVTSTPWLVALGQTQEIDWQPIKDQKKTWSKSQQGLSPLGAAVVTVVASYFLTPYFGEMIGGAAAATEVTSTVAATAATKTTLTLGQQTLATGLTAATTNVVVQLGNNGKVDGSQVLKTGLLAGLTAGITNAEVWGEGNKSLNQLAGVNNNGFFSTADKGLVNNITTDQILALGGRASISAVLDKAIFGTDLKKGFTSSLTSDLSALFAKDIGNIWSQNGTTPNVGSQTLAHMTLGAAAAKANGQDPTSGAIGGLVESALGNLLTNSGVTIDPDNKIDYTLYTSSSMLTAGLTAQLLGKDLEGVATAANVARNAAENNYLNSLEKKRRAELRKLVETGKASDAERRELIALDQKDQSSDALLWRLRVMPESVNEADKQWLVRDLATYASVEMQRGLSEKQVQNRILALVEGRMEPEYQVPYASSDSAYRADYTRKAVDAGILNDWLSLDTLFGGRRLSIPQGEQDYYKAANQAGINDYHAAWAEAGTPALFFMSGAVGTAVRVVGTAASGYQLGQGVGQLSQGEISEGLYNTILGLVGVAGNVKIDGVYRTEKGGAGDLLAAAQQPFNGQSLTNAGRAATKHPEYLGFDSTEALRQVYRTPEQINELASNAVQEILRNGVRTTGAGGRNPSGWITYTLPDGRAASWTATGEFIGFRGTR